MSVSKVFGLNLLTVPALITSEANLPFGLSSPLFAGAGLSPYPLSSRFGLSSLSLRGLLSALGALSSREPYSFFTQGSLVPLSLLSPFSPDKTHIHHQLLSLGLSHSATTGVLLSINILFIVLAIGLNNRGIFFVLPLEIALAALFSLLLYFLPRMYGKKM